MGRLDCIKLIFVVLFMLLLDTKQRKRFIREVIKQVKDKMDKEMG